MIVADSGPLIAFARIGRLDILRQVAGEVVIPQAVYEEVVGQGDARPGASEITEASWIKRDAEVDATTLQGVPLSLHSGEREAIALAQRLGVQLLIDEVRGRRYAAEQGVSVFGSLALVAEAKRGGFFSSVQTTETVGLVASSLRGDTATSPDDLLAFQRVESEPNDSLQTAHSLSLPGVVSGDTLLSDSWAELRFFNDATGEMQFIQLHDIFTFAVTQPQAVTITLHSAGGASADLNLLLFTLSSVEGPDTIFVDGRQSDLVDLSTVNDPTESITITLEPREYFTAIQAFSTPARTDYTLTIE